MKICPSCKVRYEDDKGLCSRCGANLIEEISERRKSLQKGKKTNIFLLLGLVAIPVAFVIVAVFVYLNQEPTVIKTDRASQAAPRYEEKVAEQPGAPKPQAKPLPQPQGEPKNADEVAPPAQPTFNRFGVGRKWLIDWQSKFKYQGVMQIRQQLAANRYLARITVRYFVNNNKEITVSMDGRLTINGKDVVINCSNPSVSWWDTDDFYLEWSNDTMTGYNIDKKGRRGNAVFRFVQDTSPISNQRDSPREDIRRNIEHLAEKVRSAHLNKDINKWLSCYHSSYPNLGRLETNQQELWKSYDIKEVNYRISNVQRVSDKEATADIVWNIQLYDHRTHDYTLVRQKYQTLIENGPGGWKIRDSKELAGG